MISEKLWDTFGPIINPARANKNNLTNKIIQNNKVITDYKDIGITFNYHFVNVGNTITENMPIGNNFKTYPGDSNPLSMYLKPTSKTEISNIITNLSTKTVPRPDPS